MSGPTIVADEDVSVPIPGWQPKRVVDCLDEPIPEDGEPCVLDGHPCILFANWDHGEDWSGEHVRSVHPYTLLPAAKLNTTEFWALVRKVHGL